MESNNLILKLRRKIKQDEKSISKRKSKKKAKHSPFQKRQKSDHKGLLPLGSSRKRGFRKMLQSLSHDKTQILRNEGKYNVTQDYQTHRKAHQSSKVRSGNPQFNSERWRFRHHSQIH
jgi:Holliday junction resolvasome RuvABC DNA-binding subunit